MPQLESERPTWTDRLRAQHADCRVYPTSCAAELGPWDLYSASLYFSVMTLTSVGSGEMLPVNTTERTICAAFMLFSAVLWTYVMVSACGIAANLDPHCVLFRNCELCLQCVHSFYCRKCVYCVMCV